MKLEEVETFYMNYSDTVLLGDKILVCGTVALLVGPGGVGKSLIALDLALSVASGTRWLESEEFKAPVRSKVAYFIGEDPLQYVGLRIQNICQRKGILLKDIQEMDIFSSRKPDDTFNLRTFKLSNKENLEELENYIFDNHIKLVVFDTLSNFSTYRENDNTEINQLMNQLQDIAERTDCLILLVHHTNKQSGYNTLDQSGIRGASSIGNSCKIVIGLEPNKKGVTMSVLKNNFCTGFQTKYLIRQEDNGYIIDDHNVRNINTTEVSLTDRILKFLKEQVDQVSLQEIYNGLGLQMNYKTFTNHYTNMRKAYSEIQEVQVGKVKFYSIKKEEI